MYPYTLTLSSADRSAIDWVGGRYAHGDELSRLLTTHGVWNGDWDDDGDIVFRMPEHVAWHVADIINESMLDCFNGELCEKLRTFADRIV